MGSSITAENLLVRINDTGYFRQKGYSPGELVKFLEYKVNISQSRAIDLLVESELVTFRYDPRCDPREAMDYWAIALTPKGVKQLEGN